MSFSENIKKLFSHPNEYFSSQKEFSNFIKNIEDSNDRKYT